MEPYFQAPDVTLYRADFLQWDALEENTVDLVVTSPPYNVDIRYGSHDDAMCYEDYLDFSRSWLTRVYGLLKADGRLCLNIPLDKNKGGQRSVYADLTTLARQIGFRYQSTIVWNEQNISRRTAWGSWMSASAPYVIAPVEMVVLLYKQRWKKTSGSGESDITREEFLQWTNGVWSFSGENRRRTGHPAPFPIELPRRCIKLFSFVGDTVLDPFAGSGTTLVACVREKRIAIGVELDEGYCRAAVERLKKEMRQPKLQFLQSTTPES